MACIYIDGFDKYGFNITPVTLGEWTGGSGANAIVAGAYSSGALRVSGGPFGNNIHKTFNSNYPSLIMGCRMRSSLFSNMGFEFWDGATVQVGLTFDTLGRFSVYRGSGPATTLFTSGSLATANTWHYVELEVTFDNSVGQYKLWVDGINIVTSAANQDTQATGNAFANGIALWMGSNVAYDFDDLYVFDKTGSFNNGPAGDSVVETQMPNGDDTTQFSIGASVIGAYYTENGATNVSPTTQIILLRQFTPEANCTLNSISCYPAGTLVSAKFTGVCFQDNAGSPDTLLSATNEQTGCVNGTAISLNLNTPQSLTAGVPIWIGIMQDSGIAIYRQNEDYDGAAVLNYTYSLGPPANCPSPTLGQAAWCIWGSVTTTSNFTEVKNEDDVPDSSLLNYISSDVVGQQDLYTFPNLSSIPINVSAVKVSAWCQKSDAGGRQLDLRMKSGATEDSGNSTNNPMSASFEFLYSIFDNDPDSGLAWDNTSINNASSGVKVSG